MWTVYKHTTPNGKVYIGITSKEPATKRFCNKGQGYKSNKHFWNAIQKYGWENISHEVLAGDMTREEACEMEIRLISEYKSYDPEHGYNIALGGQGFLMSDEQKKKQSEMAKAVWNKPENKELISQRSKLMWSDPDFRAQHTGKNHARYGKHLTPESRKKISDKRKEKGYRNIGWHHSDETKRMLSEMRKGRHYTMTEQWKQHIAESKRGNKNPNYGKPMPENIKKALLAINERAVVLIDGDTVIKYDSIRKASDATGVCASNIQRVCSKKRATAGGFKWEYA